MARNQHAMTSLRKCIQPNNLFYILSKWEKNQLSAINGKKEP